MKHPCWFALILLTAFLVACQSPLFADLVTESGDILYQDDFSNSFNGWTLGSSPVGTMDYYNGTFRIVVATPDYDLWSVAGQEFSDVRLEVDAGRMGGPEENRFGLICRYRDAQNFYFFVISSDGYYAVGKVTSGIRSLLGQTMMAYSPAIIIGIAPNHLRADCIGERLDLYVNDQPVSSARDADHSEGDVGLLVGTFDMPAVEIIFDDFVVIKP